MNAVAGRRPETVKLEPFRFDQMRPGCYDVDARVRDMDINGVWASVNFPSMITGFCGRVFSNAQGPRARPRVHPRVERLAVRGVVHAAPRRGSSRSASRTSPTPRSRPPRSAATPTRGFTGVTLPERPHADRPARRSGSATTGTRSSRRASRPTPSCRCTSAARAARRAPPGAPGLQLGATLFGQLSLHAVRRVAVVRATRCEHPTLKIAMSEGGIGWVADAARPARQHRRPLGLRRSAGTMRPADVLQRNFWFCTHRRPVDHRHPPPHRRREHHGRDRLPARRRHVARHPGRDREVLGPHPERTSCAVMCSENAAKLYRHPLPATCVPPATDVRADAREAGARPVAREEIVLLARALWREGYDDHLARPHHREPRRRHAAVQPVVPHVGGVRAQTT